MSSLNKTDLELIQLALETYVDGPAPVSRVAAIALRDKVRDMLKGSGGGPYRSVSIVLDPHDEDDASVLDEPWLKEADELVEGMIIDQDQKLRAAREAREATERYVKELERKLEGLKDVERIKAENERLRTEIDIVGSADAQARIDRLKHQLANVTANLAVREREIDALKTTLRNERLDRLIVEDTVEAALRTPQLSAGNPAVKALPPANTCFDCGAAVDINTHRCDECIAARPR